jgi:serine protease Do
VHSPVSTVVSFALLALVIVGSFVYISTTWPWLGIRGNDITPGIAQQLGLKQPYGLLVVTVDPGSPAERAGIKGVERISENGNQVIVGDIIIGADGKEVKSSGDFYAFLATKHIDDNVKLTVIRDNTAQEISVVLAKKPV